MNEESTWKKRGENEIDQAEKAVNGSIEKLEHLMEALTEKVESSSQKIQHFVDLGSRQKQEILRLKDTAQNALFPLYKQGRKAGGLLVSSFKEDPRPYLLGAAVILGSLFVLNHAKAKRNKMSSGIRTSEQQDYDYWAA